MRGSDGDMRFGEVAAHTEIGNAISSEFVVERGKLSGRTFSSQIES